MKISFNSFNKYSVNLSYKPVKNVTFRGLEENSDVFQKQEQTHISKLSEKFDKPIKIIFSDIDGTMIDDDTLYLNGKTYQSALELKKNNIPLVLSTGRSIDEISSFTEKLPYSPDFFILEQGAYITDKNENILYKDPLSKQDSYEVLDFYKEFSQDHSSAQLLTYINGNMYYLNSSDAEKESPFFSILIKEIDRGNTPTKFLLFFPRSLTNSGMEYIKTRANQSIKSDNLSMLITGPHYFEIMNKTSSKGIGAKFIAEKYGLSLENAVGIGDAENDISLISTIQDEGGVGIAMGNAQKCLKDKANFVTDHVYSNGFASAVDSIIAHNKQFD